MIYQRNFIKELSFTAVGIFVVLLAVLVSTQAINLLGRAADGRVAVDAVAALVGFWVIGMTPLLLVLTAFISTLTVLTRYWRDSEMGGTAQPRIRRNPQAETRTFAGGGG